MAVQIEAQLEGVICLYKEGELVAIVQKNGQVRHFTARPMTFAELCALYGADRAKES